MPDVVLALLVEAASDVRVQALELLLDGVANLLQVVEAGHLSVGLQGVKKEKKNKFEGERLQFF